MRTVRRSRAAALVAALASCALTSCAVSGIDLVQDRRVKITSPKEGSTVTLPLTVDWTTNELDLSSTGDITFGVFLDQKVIAPGKDLRQSFKKGDFCSAIPSCPDAAYLARRGVYVLKGTSLTLNELTDLRSDNVKNDTHRLVIVVLKDGKRLGEGFFSRTFTVERPDSEETG